MKILNNTNCNVHINDQVIAKYSSKDINIDSIDTRLRWLLDTNAVSILQNDSKQNKNTEKESTTNTITNISDKSTSTKKVTSRKTENITLGDDATNA